MKIRMGEGAGLLMDRTIKALHYDGWDTGGITASYEALFGVGMQEG